MTTKADKLRAELRANNNQLPRERAIKIVGSAGGLSHMLSRGEISMQDIDDVAHIVLDPDYTKARKTEKTLPIKRRAKKKRGHKKARKPRQVKSMGDIAKRLIKKSKPILLRNLIEDNLIAAGGELATAVRTGVDGIEDNPALLAALQNYERAQTLAKAA